DNETEEGRSREAVVLRLYSVVELLGYRVIIDRRAMRYGDGISTFMRSIARGDHVLLILSAKYLRSHYCMTELYEVYRCSLGEKDEFLKRIIPVVVEPNRNFGNWRLVVEYSKYWKCEFQEMKL